MEKSRTKRAMAYTVAMLILSGTINAIINMDGISELSHNKLPPLAVCALVSLAAAGGYFICLLILSLVMYFVSAAMLKGFVFKEFLVISVASLQWLPLQVMINNALAIVGIGIAELGLAASLLYIPMYLLIGLRINKEASSIINTSKMQSLSVALVGVFSLIVLTARY